MNNLPVWAQTLVHFFLPLLMLLAIYIAIKINQYIRSSKQAVRVFDKKLTSAVKNRAEKKSNDSLIYS